MKNNINDKIDVLAVSELNKYGVNWIVEHIHNDADDCEGFTVSLGKVDGDNLIVYKNRIFTYSNIPYEHIQFEGYELASNEIYNCILDESGTSDFMEMFYNHNNNKGTLYSEENDSLNIRIDFPKYDDGSKGMVFNVNIDNVPILKIEITEDETEDKTYVEYATPVEG